MSTIDILGVPHTYELIPPTPKACRPVLCFIHGWLLSRHYWQPLVEYLCPDYQCLIYDLKGFGDSVITQEKMEDKSQSMGEDDSYGNYGLAAYAKDLKILLQKLEIEQAWLIGHSLGGSIALKAADFCPERVKGVICINSGGGIYLKEEFERFRSAGQQLVKQRPRWLVSLPLIDLLFARMMVARPLDRSWGRQRLLDFVKADARAALGSLLETTTEEEVHQLPRVVSNLTQPVYFLGGENDRVMEAKYVRHLASFHPLFSPYGNNVVEIPNCGHLAMVEQPEIVSQKITQILLNHS